MGEGEGGGGQNKDPLVPLPFTLLDMFPNRRCSPRNALSNRVNPLPRWGGEFFAVDV
jgi:hypothetical protein